MNDEERAIVVDVLCSQSLADHLGDVRDAEDGLWKLLGIDSPNSDSDNPFENAQTTLKTAGYALPAYLGTHESVEQEREDGW